MDWSKVSLFRETLEYAVPFANGIERVTGYKLLA